MSFSNIGDNPFSTVCLSTAVVGFGLMSLLNIKRK